MQQADARWLALGDSITWGYPEGPAASWAGAVAEAVGVSVDNQGVNGDTLDGMLARLDGLLARGRYQCAVFMGGSNDVFWGFAPAALQRNAERIARALETRAVPFAVGLPVPLLVDAEFEARLAEFRAWVHGRFAQVIDFPAAFPAAELAALLPDGVHPSPEGYRRMAAVALPIVRGLLA